ncbi:MAG TPA: M67 family metallopeptidase [Ktedonobacterales bacterium]|nr:M67 family metallopeptidase [Ktedonobacterales bacterium]
MAKVILSTEARQAIRKDMLARPRIEACGLLIGEMTPAGDWIANEALPLRNTRNSSVRFEFDSVELLEHDMIYGERIVGVYHSHPGGPPYPSGIDTGNMENLQDSPWIWLIASFTGRRGSSGETTVTDGLSIAAFRHDPQAGLQTIPIFLAPALPSEQAQDAETPEDG